jgi:hypothetical protein
MTPKKSVVKYNFHRLSKAHVNIISQSVWIGHARKAIHDVYCDSRVFVHLWILKGNQWFECHIKIMC